MLGSQDLYALVAVDLSKIIDTKALKKRGVFKDYAGFSFQSTFEYIKIGIRHIISLCLIAQSSIIKPNENDMSAIQDSVAASSDRYSSTFTQGHLALPPAKKYLVLTCMDARIDPVQAFGIGLGDAHVIRNVSSSLLSLANFREDVYIRETQF